MDKDPKPLSFDDDDITYDLTERDLTDDEWFELQDALNQLH